MDFSDIPNVNRLLQLPALASLETSWKTTLIRQLCEQVRGRIKAGQLSEDWTIEDWNIAAEQILLERRERRYHRVINATGVVVHTNLGRAPLADEVVAYMAETARYTDLELQLEDGKRGGRISGIREKLCALTGAEDALVVNNNAAAVLLALSVVAQQKEVVISRGEMVEIGGSFRIPDVIQQGGAFLKEVGCTNRVHLSDYERGFSEETGAILRVHTSNYRIIGFTARPERSELCQLAKAHNVPVVEDLGSGLLSRAPNVPWKEVLEREESIQRAIAEGVDLVCASGDKLLGGVQAGLIVGSAKWVQACRSHPLYRAFRLDKMMLAGLEATLQIHVEGRAATLPVWTYLERTAEECRTLAETLASGLSGVSVQALESQVGGGALPEHSLPTWGVKLDPLCFGCSNVETLAKALRLGTPAVMGRIHHNSVVLDVRTVSESELQELHSRLKELLTEK